MLKIKDNVDLKVLEKYGFKKIEKAGILKRFYYELQVQNKYDDTEYSSIYVSGMRYLEVENENTLGVSTMCVLDHTLDILYNLIQDGLVEKVVG